MSYPAKWIRPCLLPLSTMVSFNYQLIYDWSLIKSGRRVDYILPRNDISLKLVRFDVILFSVPSSIYPPAFPPTGSPILSNPLPNVPDRCAAKFNVRQVSGSRETRRSIFRIGISTRRFTIRIHPFFDCPSPPSPLYRHHRHRYRMYTYTRTSVPFPSISRENEMKLGRLPGFICNQERNYLC